MSCTKKPGFVIVPFGASSGKTCLTWVDYQTILKLTCWVCGTNSSTLERERARAHKIGEPEQTEIELDSLRFSPINFGPGGWPRLSDYSQVDKLGSRYKCVNFGPGMPGLGQPGARLLSAQSVRGKR